MKVSLRQTAGDPPRLPGADPAIAGLLSVLVGLYIALTEIDHVLAQVLDEGRTWAPTGLTAPTGWGEKVEGWEFFGGPASTVDPRVGDWLIGYGATDCLFALCYSALLVICLRRVTEPGRTRLAGTVLLVAGGVADILENVQIMAGAPWPRLLVAATVAKWVTLVPGVLLVAWQCRRHVARWLRLAPKAIYTHRYSVLIVLPLGLLGLARGPDILEQVPDIQRAWVDEGGLRDFVAAGAVMALLVIAVFVIGRQRTHHLWERTCTRYDRPEGAECDDPVCPNHTAEVDPDRKPMLAIWFIGPTLLAFSALLIERQGGPVSWGRLAVFCAIPLVIGVGSSILRALHTRLERPVRRPVSRARFDAAAWLGDVLVGLLPVIAGLGAIRAFTAVLALEGADALTLLLFASGWIALVAAWWGLHLVVRAVAQAAHTDRYGDPGFVDRLLALLTPGVATVMEPEPPGTGPMPPWLREAWDGVRRQWLSWAVLALSGVTLAVVAANPVPLAEGVGVIATFQLALGSLSVVVAALVILFQPGGAPEIFWKLRLAFVPVTTLLVLGCLLAARAGGGADVHGIRTVEATSSLSTLADRPTVDELLDTWLTDGSDCAEALPGTSGLRVRPLLLYAAEGGGIRAAYWTTAAIDRLAETTTQDLPEVCRSAFLSSGASGGSVGLSIASVRSTGDASSAVAAIAGPEALGAASDGMVLRDTIFAATGLPMPSLLDPRTDGADWSDRATLIEQAWEGDITELTTPYLQPRTDTWDWGPTGALVLNSTSSTTSCRTLVSQLSLPGSTTAECAPGQPAAGSTDLLACTGQLRTTTAALLTARFPYVTPSGVVGCTGATGDSGSTPDKMQIVDGGYAENTGIGTLVDLAPRILAEVRRHNTCAFGPDEPDCVGEPAVDTLVVPQLVYFDNGTGSDLVTKPGGLDLEVLVPPLTLLSAKGSLYSARSQLERAQGTLATAQLWASSAPGSEQAADAVDDWRGNPVAVVYQATRPAIAAPLGWVLSDASTQTMDDALCAQDEVERLDGGAASSQRPQQFGTIEDVLDLLPGGTVACPD